MLLHEVCCLLEIAVTCLPFRYIGIVNWTKKKKWKLFGCRSGQRDDCEISLVTRDITIPCVDVHVLCNDTIPVERRFVLFRAKLPV